MTAATLHERIDAQRSAFSAKQLQVARFLLDNEAAAAFLSVREVAERVGVGAATVVRFCRELGYQGFSEYQDETRQRVLAHETFTQRLRKQIDAGNFDTDLAGHMASAQTTNIENTLGRLKAVDLDSTVTAILNASAVRIFGSGLSACVAVAAEHSLSVLGLQAHAVTDGGLSHLRELSRISDQDVVLTISVWRYVKDSVLAAKAGRQAGAKVIALTDSELAPVAQFSDVVMVADTQGLVHARSVLGLMSLVDLLAASIATTRSAESLAALEQLDTAYQQHGVLWDG